MANIKIELGHPIIEGMPLSFRAPCNCTEVNGIKVSYPDGEGTAFIVFSFADAHGNDLSGLGNLFAANAMVRVVLDPSNAKAYIQNADTNAYLEGRFKGATVVPVASGKGLLFSDIGRFLRVDAAATITVPAGVYPIGVEVEVFRNTSGAVTIAAGSGVSFAIPGNTALVSESQTIADQYSSVVLKCIDTDVWSIQGAI
jgi:hypothetical protein